MQKGFIAALVIGAPMLALMLFITLERQEQIRAERTELVLEQKLEDAFFDLRMARGWNDDAEVQRLKSKIARLKERLDKARTSKEEADAAAKESLAALEKSLEENAVDSAKKHEKRKDQLVEGVNGGESNGSSK